MSAKTSGEGSPRRLAAAGLPRVLARVLPLVLALVAVAALAAQQLHLGALRRQPRYDEVAYVAMARDFHRMGGVAGTVRCYLAGRCLDDNRFPAFELVLQAFAHDRQSFYADAKLVTLGTALLLLLCVYLLARRAFSPAVAGAAVVLLALMPAFGEIASGVLADVLFAAVLLAAVYAIAAALERGAWAALGAGALVGLAYLAKGNGHLALLGLASAGWVLHGRRLARRPLVYVAAAGFVAAAFFLLWRNAIVYKNPFHNFNDRPLWLEGWDQTWRLLRDPEWDRIGLRWYLQRHSVLDLVWRVVRGLGQAVGVLLYTAGLGITAGTPPDLSPSIPAAVVRVATGVAVVALAARGLVDRYRAGFRAEVLAVTHVGGWLLLAFAIGGQGVGGVAPRFMLPLVVLCVPHAAHALVARGVPAAERALGRLAAATPLAALLLLAPVVAKLAWFAPALAANPRRAFTVPPRWAETSAWLAEHLAPGERYAFPHTSLYSTWDRPSPDPDARWIYIYSAPPAEMRRVLDEGKPWSLAPRWDGPPLPITKLFVDMQARDVASYEDRMSNADDGHGPLSFLGWPRCFADGGRPSRFLIFCRN